MTAIWEVQVAPPPRLEASCAKHGVPFPYCDPCASMPAMARWSSGLTASELARALVVLARGERYYSSAEKQAVLFEAAKRIHDRG